MPTRKQARYIAAAARARLGRHKSSCEDETVTEIIEILDSETSSDSETEVALAEANDNELLDPWIDEDNEGSLISEADGAELLMSLEKQAAVEISVIEKTFNAFDRLMEKKSSALWKKAESNRHLGYTRGGLSDRSGREKRQKARKKEQSDSATRET
jgi:hypothetical protein